MSLAFDRQLDDPDLEWIAVMKEWLIKLALMAFFAIQGYLNGEYAYQMPFDFKIDLGVRLGLAVFALSILATLLQTMSRGSVQGTPFMGLCFLVGIGTTFLSAHLHQAVDKVAGFLIVALFFAAGFTLGSLVKLRLNYRITNE